MRTAFNVVCRNSSHNKSTTATRSFSPAAENRGVIRSQHSSRNHMDKHHTPFGVLAERQRVHEWIEVSV
jgi:hypothetical protein